jgi:hypothetical protein
MNQNDYLDANFKVFGLYGVDKKGVCGCGDPKCKALFKHPIISNWQRVPHWSESQIETMHEMGQFNTGFGVLCDGYLVVDIDPRNGGTLDSLPFLDITKTFTVQTGGGGLHIYYKAPEGAALVSHVPDIKGIDFKSSGFVVGAGSLHSSGATYDPLHGDPSSVIDAPADLIELLKRPAFYRAQTSSGAVDVTMNDITEMLSYIDPDCTYDEWIRVGMAVHHATLGDGFTLWDEWSAKGSKYDSSIALEKHWHSFGKSANPAGIGTLMYYAELAGYARSVEFVSDVVFDDVLDDLSDIDLNSPTGFVGDLTRWVDAQCLYSRQSLAVAVALQAVGNLAGGRYIDELNGVSSNLFSFCVAGSGTGKEAIQTAYADILRSVSMQQCLYGGIKSEQELIRNLIRNPSSFYSIDEFGTMFAKIKNAGKSGAHYLEGLIGTCMSLYSKANSFYIPNGDLKDDTKKALQTEIKAVKKIMDETGKGHDRLARLEEQLITIDDGIKNPFLSITGYTTPVTFDHLVDYEQATNGFLARALLFQDLETNPKRKQGFKREPLPMAFQATLSALSIEGDSKVAIPTDNQAKALLDGVYEYFWEMAEKEKGRTGLEAICRRGYEICAKVSFILAIPSGVRTAHDVRWAFALAKRDIETKIKLAYANMSAQASPADALAVKIQKMLSKDHGETRAVVINRCRPVVKSDVEKMIATLIAAGYIVERADEDSQKKTLKLFSAN